MVSCAGRALLPKKGRLLSVCSRVPPCLRPGASPLGACQTSREAGKIQHLQVREKGRAMPSDDWATRHPELVHWLHQAEDELVRYEPIDDILTPAAVFPGRLLPFFVAIEPAVDRQERRRHRWASTDCLYSPADMDTLRTFFAQVHGRQDTFLFLDCVCALRASNSW